MVEKRAEKRPEKRIETFREFWPFYLSEHSHPATRWLHFAGSTVGLGCFGGAVATAQWWLIPAGVVAGYAFAWLAHFTVEHNRPATFTYPVWSFVADWKMWFLMLTGRISAELRKQGITRN